MNLYGDSDFFHIYVDGSSGLGLSIDCYLVDTMQPFWDYTRFRLYDDTLSSLATISLRTIGMDTLDYTLPAAGDYYLAVSGTSFTNIVQYDISWESEVIVPWGGPTTLDGGADSGSAEEITFLDHWYTSTIPVYEDSMWYSVTVSTSSTYEIYWDERYSGSGTYTGDMMVFVYQTDGTTLYDSADSGYNDPLEITPVETTLLIEVNAFWEGGSFAVGLTEQ